MHFVARGRSTSPAGIAVLVFTCAVLGCSESRSVECDRSWIPIAPLPAGLLVGCAAPPVEPESVTWVRATGDGLVVLGSGCSGARYHLAEDRWSELPPFGAWQPVVVVAGDRLVALRTGSPSSVASVSVLDLAATDPAWRDLPLLRPLMDSPKRDIAWTGRELVVVSETRTPSGPYYSADAIDLETGDIRPFVALATEPFPYFAPIGIAVVGTSLVALGSEDGSGSATRLRVLDLTDESVTDVDLEGRDESTTAGLLANAELVVGTRLLTGARLQDVGAVAALPSWEVLDTTTMTFSVGAIELAWHARPVTYLAVLGVEPMGPSAVVGDRVLAGLPDAPTMVSVATWETWRLRSATVDGVRLAGPSVAVGETLVVVDPERHFVGARLDLCAP